LPIISHPISHLNNSFSLGVGAELRRSEGIVLKRTILIAMW
jgi:hypothetical protein